MEKIRRNWIITGGTGFIGRELVYRLLTRTDDRVTLLLRRSEEVSRNRINSMLRTIDPCFHYDHTRLCIWKSDVKNPNLGLRSTHLGLLSEYKNTFIHLAASTRFTDTIEQARQINFYGTQHAVSIATALHKAGALHCFAYISTAFVHGHRTGVVDVNDSLIPGAARNTYEQSKCETEVWIRSQTNSLPTVIFRPSIVVGDSRTGRSSGISTIYWAVKMMLRGHKRFLGSSDAALDIVPVDYVTDAILELVTQKESIGRCFPLVAGPEFAVTVSRLAQMIAAELALPVPTVFNPSLVLRYQRGIRFLARIVGREKIADQMLAYLPYFSQNPEFDAAVTNNTLKQCSLHVRPLEQYIGLLLHSFVNRVETTNQQKGESYI